MTKFTHEEKLAGEKQKPRACLYPGDGLFDSCSVAAGLRHRPSRRISGCLPRAPLSVSAATASLARQAFRCLIASSLSGPDDPVYPMRLLNILTAVPPRSDGSTARVSLLPRAPGVTPAETRAEHWFRLCPTPPQRKQSTRFVTGLISRRAARDQGRLRCYPAIPRTHPFPHGAAALPFLWTGRCALPGQVEEQSGWPWALPRV